MINDIFLHDDYGFVSIHNNIGGNFIMNVSKCTKKRFRNTFCFVIVFVIMVAPLFQVTSHGNSSVCYYVDGFASGEAICETNPNAYCDHSHGRAAVQNKCVLVASDGSQECSEKLNDELTITSKDVLEYSGCIVGCLDILRCKKSMKVGEGSEYELVFCFATPSGTCTVQ
jgi:hypothetical protein